MMKTDNYGEHAFVRIERDLKNGQIPKIVLLCGKEDYLTVHYKDTVLNKVLEPASKEMDLTVLEGDEASPERIEEAGEMLPLLSYRRVVLLPDYINEHGALPPEYKEHEDWFDEVLQYLDRVPEEMLLLITASKPVTTGDYRKKSDGKRLKKLQDAVNNAGGAVYEFGSLEEAQLRSFINKRFRAAGKSCDSGVLRDIIRNTGYGSRYTEYDLYMLEGDLQKLIACAGSDPKISARDVDDVLGKNPEINIFQMLDAIGRNRKDQALINLNILFESGESEFGILAMLTGQLELMLIAKELQEEGTSRKNTVEYLKKKERIRDYRAKNVTEASSRFSIEQLRFMLSCAFEIEEQIKTGLMEGRLALEFFIARI